MKFISRSNGIFKKRKSFTLVFVIILAIILSFNPFKNYNYKLGEHQNIVETRNLRISNPDDNIFRLIYGTLDGPADLDPHNAWDGLSFEVIDQVCEGLFANNGSDLSIIPILAEALPTWINSTNCSINLRQGIIFHDGTPFNATAVKWTFERLAYLINNNMSKLAELYQYYDSNLNKYVPYIDEINILSEYSVEFIFNTPFALFSQLLTFPGSYILSPSSTPAIELIDTASGDLVGTGPFVYDYYKPNLKVKFHAFENYWDGVSNVSILEFSIINNAEQRNNALLSGDVDIITDPMIDFIADFKANPDIVLDNGTSSEIAMPAKLGLTSQYLGMNNYWINKTYREAISHAINYSYIIDELMRGNVTRLNSPVPPGVPGYNISVIPPEFNISYAREIMQSMNFGVGFDTAFPGSDENLWSSSIFTTFNYTYYEGDWFLEDISTLLQNNLSRIGINIISSSISYKEFYNYLFNEENFNRNMLQLFWFSWDSCYIDTSMWLHPLFSNRSNAANFIQYNGGFGENGPFKPYGTSNYDSAKDVQILLEQAQFETDFPTKMAIYQKIQSLIVERDMPCGFGFLGNKYYAYRSHIIGFAPNILGKLYFHKLLQDSSKYPRNTIYLDGNIDWAFFKDFGECSGYGNLTDPYVIKDFKIGNEPSKSCILVENSDIYFKIENCTLFNSDKGIELINVKNAILYDNNCSNNAFGISIINSTYVNATKNIVNYNDVHGLELQYSDNNIISANTLNNNNNSGLYLYESNNNTIVDNTDTISYNGIYGIYLELSNFNNISKNTINYNQYGIYLYQSNYNYIIENELIGNEKAIEEIDCIGNIIENNKIPKGGVILIELLILIIIIGVVTIIGIGGVIAWKKKITLPIKVRKKQIEKTKPEKGEKDVLKIEKQKNKTLKNLRKRMITVESLIANNKRKIAIENLNEMENIAKSYNLIDILKTIEENINYCKQLEIETINRIKKTVLNLGTKFTRLELMDISEKSGIKDENLIEIVILDMIRHKEIVGEYFASSKALALEVAAPISKPEKVKEYIVFLSYSTLDTDYFQISKVVRSLKLYPEISEVLFWEVDSKQNIVEFMEETLKKTNVFVMFCSGNSIKSKAVKDEWQSAFQLRKEDLMKMIPVYKEEEHIPYLLKPMLNVKFTEDNFEGFINKLYEEILR